MRALTFLVFFVLTLTMACTSKPTPIPEARIESPFDRIIPSCQSANPPMQLFFEYSGAFSGQVTNQRKCELETASLITMVDVFPSHQSAKDRQLDSLAPSIVGPMREPMLPSEVEDYFDEPSWIINPVYIYLNYPGEIPMEGIEFGMGRFIASVLFGNSDFEQENYHDDRVRMWDMANQLIAALHGVN